MARNAMPPPGDTDGAVRSDEAGEAPHSVVVLPATSDLSSTVRPSVERDRRERGDEDGAVGVAGGGLVASSTTRRRRMTRSVTVILGPRPMSHREEVTSQRGSIVDEDVHGDGMVRRHAGQARIVHASTCYNAAAANRRSCVRNVLTDVAQQEDQDGNHRTTHTQIDYCKRL